MTTEKNIINNQKLIIQQNDYIIKMLNKLLPDAGKNLWMTEQEVMERLQLSKRRLAEYRKSRVIEWRYGSNGRNPQYNRKSVEDFQANKTNAYKLKIA